MTSTVLSASGLGTSLREDLESLGLPILDKPRVQVHKKSLVQEYERRDKYNIFGRLVMRAINSHHRWERAPVSSTRFEVPPHLRERVRRAGQLPNTRIMIEHFRYDPFIVVVRRHLLYTEECYIGAWATDVPEFDKA